MEFGYPKAVIAMNHSRLARDAAHTFVKACESGAHFVWLSDQVRTVLGPAHQRALADTRQRLIRPVRADAGQLETGTWLRRVDHLLRERPDVGEALRRLVSEAGSRRSRSQPYWPVN